jgi:hypothetical protein
MHAVGSCRQNHSWECIQAALLTLRMGWVQICPGAHLNCYVRLDSGRRKKKQPMLIEILKCTRQHKTFTQRKIQTRSNLTSHGDILGSDCLAP